MSIRDRIEAVAQQPLAERALRVAILGEIRAELPFDAYVWLLTDPESSVGCLPLAEVPSLSDVASLIRLRYLTAENRWTDIGSATVRTLVDETRGQLSRSRLWAEGLARYGISDAVTTVLRDQYGCWGFVELWRIGGTFSRRECGQLEALAPILTTALRRSLLPSFDGTSTPAPRQSGPAIVLLDDDLTLLTQTAQAETYLRALLPAAGDRHPVPAAVYNVAAQLLARENGIDDNPAQARLPLDGRWLTARAARADPTESTDRSRDVGRDVGRDVVGSLIAVSIEVATPAERTELYARTAGLSDREGELLRLLVNGSDTRAVAHRLFVSEHTVQDHLKSIFAKVAVNNRKTLIARATGAA